MTRSLGARSAAQLACSIALGWWRWAPTTAPKRDPRSPRRVDEARHAHRWSLPAARASARTATWRPRARAARRPPQAAHANAPKPDAHVSGCRFSGPRPVPEGRLGATPAPLSPCRRLPRSLQRFGLVSRRVHERSLPSRSVKNRSMSYSPRLMLDAGSSVGSRPRSQGAARLERALGDHGGCGLAVGRDGFFRSRRPA
jgi:hypothetical protein